MACLHHPLTGACAAPLLAEASRISRSPVPEGHPNGDKDTLKLIGSLINQCIARGDARHTCAGAAKKKTAGSPRPFRDGCRGRAVGEQRRCARARRLLLARALVGLATRHAAAEIRLVAALRLLGMLLTVLLAPGRRLRPPGMDEKRHAVRGGEREAGALHRNR